MLSIKTIRSGIVNEHRRRFENLIKQPQQQQQQQLNKRFTRTQPIQQQPASRQLIYFKSNRDGKFERVPTDTQQRIPIVAVKEEIKPKSSNFTPQSTAREYQQKLEKQHQEHQRQLAEQHQEYQRQLAEQHQEYQRRLEKEQQKYQQLKQKYQQHPNAQYYTLPPGYLSANGTTTRGREFAQSTHNHHYPRSYPLPYSHAGSVEWGGRVFDVFQPTGGRR